MLNQITRDQLESHKNALERLYQLNPETAESQFKIAQFLLDHPKLAGLVYSAADILRKEQNPKIRAVAIKTVEEEMVKRSDVASPTFRLNRRRLSGNQIKKILHDLHADMKSPADHGFSPGPKKVSTCSHRHNCIPSTGEVRNEVVSFRATEDTEDAIGYLAQQFGISISHLVSELLTVKRRFGCSLKNAP